jgi:hypothetical protein
MGPNLEVDMSLELAVLVGLVIVWMLYLFHRQLGALERQVRASAAHLEEIRETIRELDLEDIEISLTLISEKVEETRAACLAAGHADRKPSRKRESGGA